MVKLFFNNSMKISIITPVYNAEPYISKAISCILNQSYKNFELILIDDGSTDNSGIICDKYALKEPKIKVFHQKNKGVSAARNIGLEQVTGEWVCFFDSDDEVTPEWLRSFINAIDNQTDIIFQGAQIIDSQDNDFFKLENNIYDRNNMSNLIDLWQNQKGHIGSAWSKIIKASIINKYNIRFDETIHNYEDWVFLTYVLSHSKNIKTITSTHYIYNHKNSNLTNQKKIWTAEQRLTILEARYRAAYSLKSINENCFQIYIAGVTKLLTQTIFKIYKEKYPKSERIKLLYKLRQYPINTSKLLLKEKIILIILNKFSKFSDLFFKILF